MAPARRPTKHATASGVTKFDDEELAAARERAKELKAQAEARAGEDGEADVLAKIAGLPDADRKLAERIHAIVTETAPDLVREDLLRHARVRQERQDRLLLPARIEVQGALRDPRLRDVRQARRRRDVADGLGGDEAQRRR